MSCQNLKDSVGGQAETCKQCPVPPEDKQPERLLLSYDELHEIVLVKSGDQHTSEREAIHSIQSMRPPHSNLSGTFDDLQAIASFIIPIAGVSQHPSLRRETEVLQERKAYTRSCLELILFSVIEIVIVIPMEVLVIKAAGEIRSNNAKIVLVFFCLNYLTVLALLIDALRSKNSIQLMALIIIKSTLAFLTLFQCLSLMSALNCKEKARVTHLDAGITFTAFACLFGYGFLSRQLRVKLKWHSAVTVGGFSERSQKIIEAYFVFDCAMKFCYISMAVWFIDTFVIYGSLSQWSEAWVDIINLVVFLVITITVHILGRLESRFFIVPVIAMLALVGLQLWKAIVYKQGTCSFCQELATEHHGRISLNFFVFLSTMLSFYLVISVILGAYLYTIFIQDKFSGQLIQYLNGTKNAKGNLDLY